MDLAVTDRTRLRRKKDRGRFDWATVSAIPDEGFVCNLGFVNQGHAVVIPTAYGRVDRDLYVHGAAANQALRAAATGIDVCVTVTLVDALVLARSAIHHSMNYRSVMIFGHATKVDDVAEKRAAILAIVDHVVPGRAADTRAPSDDELRATLVLRLPIVEASAKIRTGGPIEEPDDLSLPYWGGQIPLRLAAGAPIHDGLGVTAVPEPAYATRSRG